MTERTLIEAIQAHSNDYTALEETYRAATKDELVLDPFHSVRSRSDAMTLSMSVVLPAWNAQDTIEQSLIAIEQSSFNQRYPHLLQVIVVDDGSTDSTWEILTKLNLSLNLIGLRQEHHSCAQAMNTGVSVAEGDIIISCDADMILTTFTLEEMAKRHQVVEHVLLIGFRYDVSPQEPSIQPAVLSHNLPCLCPQFYKDNRVTYHWDGHIYPGWPENMCRESQHLKALGHGKQLWLPDGDKWDLPRMVYGALFSLRREDWWALQGFDERFFGWGWEDTLLGAYAIAYGNFIVPVYSATGLHIAHSIRSPRQWKESAVNKELLMRTFKKPVMFGGVKYLEKAKERIIQSFRLTARHTGGEIPRSSYEVFHVALSDPLRLGDYYSCLGRFEAALDVFVQFQEDKTMRAQALYKQGMLLQALRRFAEASAAFKEAANMQPDQALPLIHLALAQAARGDFATANQYMKRAEQIEPGNRLLSFVFYCPAYKHIRRGEKYAYQGYHALALQDFEAALIQEPTNLRASRARDHSLSKLAECVD